MSTKIQGKWAGNANRFVFFDPHNNHESALPVGDVVFYDDFLGQAFDATHNWTVEDTGAATETLVADSASGYMALALTNANEKQEAGLHVNDFRNWVLNQGLVFESRCRLQTLPTGVAEMYIGLAGDYVEGIIATDGPAEHMFFVADGNGVIVIHADDTANNNDDVATGVTVLATEWHVYKIDCSDITDIRFYIDGERVGSATTIDMSTVAALVLQPYFMCHKETGAAAEVGTMWIDYVRIYQDRS